MERGHYTDQISVSSVFHPWLAPCSHTLTPGALEQRVKMKTFRHAAGDAELSEAQHEK